jgi:hypothetical protein
MELICKTRCKIVKDVRVTAHACQEQQQIAIATPIQVMQSNSVHIDKVTFVRRPIHHSSSMKYELEKLFPVQCTTFILLKKVF